jgi:hypothetical protein
MQSYQKIFKAILALAIIVRTSILHAGFNAIEKLPKDLVGEWLITDVVTTPASFTSDIGVATKEQFEAVKKAINGKKIEFGEQGFRAIDEVYCSPDLKVRWRVYDGEESAVAIAEEMRKFHRNARSGSYKTDHAVAFAACSGQDAPSFEEALKLKAYSPSCIKSRELFKSKISKGLFWGSFIVLSQNIIVMDNDDWYICLKKQRSKN